MFEGIFGLKPLPPKKELAVVNFVIKMLPAKIYPPGLHQAAAARDSKTRNLALAQAYLEAEAELLRSHVQGWGVKEEIRAKLKRRFKLDKFIFNEFSAIFLSRKPQFFFLLKSIAVDIQSRVDWSDELFLGFLRESASGTPLEKMSDFSDLSWQKAYEKFEKLYGDKSEDNIADSFRRVLERAFRELIKERGDVRARVVLEEVIRNIRQEYGELEILTRILEVLPPSVFMNEKLTTFSSREGLIAAIKGQSRELVDKNIALEHEAIQLKESISQLQKSKERAESIAASQQEFISVVAHQFRTPLTAIRWQAEALSELLSKNPELKEFTETINTIRERSLFLITVLENIFDVMALEAGRYEVSLKELNLSDLVESARKQAEAGFSDRGLVLKLDAKIPGQALVLADERAVLRALNIFLENAAQYSEKGGIITIQTSKREYANQPAQFIVGVKDEGIGIRSEDLARMFDRLFRAQNARRKAPDGTGIALYISKLIIELLGGKVWAESKGEHTGATFYFSLPEKSDGQEQESVDKKG